MTEKRNVARVNRFGSDEQEFHMEDSADPRSIAYENGKRAAMAGEPVEENPHEVGKEFVFWKAGWITGNQQGKQ